MNGEKLKFMECRECRMKSGSPSLCVSCTHNRAVIAHLHDALIGPPKALPDPPEGNLEDRIGECERRLSLADIARDSLSKRLDALEGSQ